MRRTFCSLLFASALLTAQIAPPGGGYQPGAGYYWVSTPVANSAQLLTLVCKSCTVDTPTHDVPVVSLLRDTLGDSERENDRVMFVWLLGYSRQRIGQRLLAAVPFFYWRMGAPGGDSGTKDLTPLMDLSAPARPILPELGRNLLQWTLLDPLTRPVRASSRAYRANAADDERLHLEEAISYLEQAPSGDSAAEPTSAQLDVVIARLTLRKQLLGGLVGQRQAEQRGKEERFERERIRSRNWELLRQCAEKTGLLFEPLRIGDQDEDFAVVWFPVGGSGPEPGPSTNLIWKILNLRNPWSDDRLDNWHGPRFTRAIDANGALLAPEAGAGTPVTLIPLGVYSLNYPRMPLLLVDFRDKLHLKRHELTQRTVNQIANGLIGVSHFANWYYFAGADVYDFVVSRHGAAMDQPARHDCYSQFRAALAVDKSVDPQLRSEMQKRVDSLAVNPLESSPQDELRGMEAHYSELQAEANDGRLLQKLQLARRAELADFGRSAQGRSVDALLHVASIGLYTRRAGENPDNILALDRERRVTSNLDFLDQVLRPGTQPEVAFDAQTMATSVNELSALLPEVKSQTVKRHAAATLSRLRQLTKDQSLQADCAFAIAGITGTVEGSRTGIAASARSASLNYLAPLDRQK